MKNTWPQWGQLHPRVRTHVHIIQINYKSLDIGCLIIFKGILLKSYEHFQIFVLSKVWIIMPITCDSNISNPFLVISWLSVFCSLLQTFTRSFSPDYSCLHINFAPTDYHIICKKNIKFHKNIMYLYFRICKCNLMIEVDSRWNNVDVTVIFRKWQLPNFAENAGSYLQILGDVEQRYVCFVRLMVGWLVTLSYDYFGNFSGLAQSVHPV